MPVAWNMPSLRRSCPAGGCKEGQETLNLHWRCVINFGHAGDKHACNVFGLSLLEFLAMLTRRIKTWKVNGSSIK